MSSVYNQAQVPPRHPKFGDVYLNTLTEKLMVYAYGEWYEMNPSDPNEPVMSPIDKTMTEFAKKVNAQPGGNRRMIWWTDKDRAQKKENDPDYWLGVAYAFYEEKRIDTNEFTDIVIALHPFSPKSSYYRDLIGKLRDGTL